MSTGHFQKLPQQNKFMIGSVPEIGQEAITVEAQFNPKELQIDSPISWTEHKVIGAQSVATKPMEFSAMGAETVKVELLFDAYEEGSDFVVNAIAALKSLASVRDPYSSKSNSNHQRPSFCVAKWGTQQPFRCVIESFSVKYTMFAVDGTPLRAAVVLGLKSGMRAIEAPESDFERTSRERLKAQRDKYQAQRNERETERRLYERERERRYEEARASVSDADRRLAEREERVKAERQQVEAARAQRAREIDAREQRIARERRVAEEERELAAERDRDSAMREQRKKDFDLE